jgi:hypothetical protein
MKNTLKLILFAGTLLSLGIAHAQEAKELAKHPGDILKFEIVFEGPNADKIKTVGASLSMQVGPPKDQAGFTNGFGTERQFSPTSQKTFVVEITVPPNAATGDYFISVGATATEGSASYSNGNGFTISPIHVENPKTFTPPKIEVKELH